MNATKRKFNALLQGLNSPRPSSPDQTSSTSVLASSLKRHKTSGAAATMENPLLPAKAPIGQSLLRKRVSHVSLGTQNQAAAKYCPSDREQLLRRLATFQEITDWTPKPDRVNEVEWAKRGWVCQGKERVRCVLCHKELVVKLNRKEQDGKEVAVLVASEIEDAMVDKYVELMTTEHQVECLWRKRGCEDSILRVSFANASMTLEALRQRYDDLCSRHTFLPYEFNLRLPDGLVLDDVVTLLPTAFFTHPPPVEIPGQTTADGPNRTALALALLGWQGLTNPRIGPVPNTASCSTCLRRLGLWMFKSKEVDADGKVLVAAPMDYLDPVREHRFFCPWKNADAQVRGDQSSKDDLQPAWKLLIQMIKNEHDLRDFYESRARKTTTGTVAEKARPQTPAPGVDQFSEVSEIPQLVVNATPGADDDDAQRDAKDKERWARLRKVKSLFDTKGSKRLRKQISRPTSVLSTASKTDN